MPRACLPAHLEHWVGIEGGAGTGPGEKGLCCFLPGGGPRMFLVLQTEATAVQPILSQLRQGGWPWQSACHSMAMTTRLPGRGSSGTLGDRTKDFQTRDWEQCQGVGLPTDGVLTCSVCSLSLHEFLPGESGNRTMGMERWLSRNKHCLLLQRV